MAVGVIVPVIFLTGQFDFDMAAFNNNKFLNDSNA